MEQFTHLGLFLEQTVFARMAIISISYLCKIWSNISQILNGEMNFDCYPIAQGTPIWIESIQTLDR